MPVIDDDPVAPAQPAPTTVRVAEPEFKSVTVDTRYEPVASLLTSIQGSSWIANYFSQILAEDSQLSGQQQTLDPVYQQYRLVKDFELKVSTPLNSSQDEVTKTMKMTGAANVYPFLIPNIGDMFIADVGDGREGIFKVTSSERKSIFKDTCYAIEYELVSFAEPERTGDLYAKVQETLQFVKDFLMHGQNPMLVESDFVVVEKLAERYHDIVRVYFRMVMSDEYKTVCIPGQEYPTYDPHHLRAVLGWFSTDDAEELRQIRQLNVDGDPAMRSYTLWDALAQQNARHLKLAARKMGLVSARAFTRDPMMEGIFWSGMRYVVYPKDPTVSVNFEQVRVPKDVLDEQITNNAAAAPMDLTQLGDLVPPGLPYEGAPLLHPVLVDDFYVFSEAFYGHAATGQSKLELAVWDYLQGKPVDRQLLLSLCETYYAWGSLERFYYLPIVALLIKASIRYL